MSDFLGTLERIRQTIKRSLQKSFCQKMADWAMQLWSSSKDKALAQVTELMRNSLKATNETESASMVVVNPVNSSVLSSVDYDESKRALFHSLDGNVSERRSADHLTGEE
ncbi:hypothetical protein MPSEU_000429900 [Mayamaea pseudoterrestris]|nr:hypothetical protein MPSEU_000429900 [Mayamaea pseudoterrestris]